MAILKLKYKIQCQLETVKSTCRRRWVDSLAPSDTIWRQRSGSTLAQVMACCLTAPGHYLNQSWLIISKVKWHSSKSKFTRDISITEIILKIKYLKFHSNFPGANELNVLMVIKCYDREEQLGDYILKHSFIPLVFSDPQCCTNAIIIEIDTSIIASLHL